MNKQYEWATTGMPQMPRYKEVDGAQQRLARFYVMENSWGRWFTTFETYLYLPVDSDLTKMIGATR